MPICHMSFILILWRIMQYCKVEIILIFTTISPCASVMFTKCAAWFWLGLEGLPLGTHNPAAHCCYTNCTVVGNCSRDPTWKGTRHIHMPNRVTTPQCPHIFHRSTLVRELCKGITNPQTLIRQCGENIFIFHGSKLVRELCRGITNPQTLIRQSGENIFIFHRRTLVRELCRDITHPQTLIRQSGENIRSYCVRVNNRHSPEVSALWVVGQTSA